MGRFDALVKVVMRFNARSIWLKAHEECDRAGGESMELVGRKDEWPSVPGNHNECRTTGHRSKKINGRFSLLSTFSFSLSLSVFGNMEHIYGPATIKKIGWEEQREIDHAISSHSAPAGLPRLRLGMFTYLQLYTSSHHISIMLRIK